MPSRDGQRFRLAGPPQYVASHASPYVPGLIAAYFLSRRGPCGSYARSATPQNLGLGLRLRTAHGHGGLMDATVCSAGKRKTTLDGHTGERGPKTGSR